MSEYPYSNQKPPVPVYSTAKKEGGASDTPPLPMIRHVERFDRQHDRMESIWHAHTHEGPGGRWWHKQFTTTGDHTDATFEDAEKAACQYLVREWYRDHGETIEKHRLTAISEIARKSIQRFEPDGLTPKRGIVERLRDRAYERAVCHCGDLLSNHSHVTDHPATPMLDEDQSLDVEAADTITTLRARLAELEGVVILDATGKPIGFGTNHYTIQLGTGKVIGVGVIGMGEDPDSDFESPPILEVRDEDGNEWCLKVEHLYGTREAATNAKIVRDLPPEELERRVFDYLDDDSEAEGDQG